MTLKGPVNQDQLVKIKEILKNPQIYKDKVQKNQYPALGEYAKSFEPRILTSHCIHTQNVNEINHIDISGNYQDLRSTRLNTSVIQITKVRIMIQITRKIKITKITVPTALSTRTATAAIAATMAPSARTSVTRVTTQKYHPMWK